MRTGAEALVAALEAEGVTRIYGVPGEENLDLMEAVRRSAIRFVTCRHEQAAGFMAATEGRLTGQAGVCLATLAPGATNLLTAAAHAQLGGMPMVMLTGQKPIKSSKQGLFQILDVVDLMQPVTKYTRQLASATTIPSRVREAFRRAEEERPGAVHLELPEDIARDPCDSALIEPSFVRRPVVEAKAVSRAAELLESAQQPIVLIGAGANRNLVAEALRGLHGVLVDHAQRAEVHVLWITVTGEGESVAGFQPTMVRVPSFVALADGDHDSDLSQWNNSYWLNR